MSDEETTTDELLREALWSRRLAQRIVRRYAVSLFGQHAAVLAVIHDHDRRKPDAPPDGPDRILSIVAHTRQLAQEVAEHPEKFDAAASINANHTGRPDPGLLALARRVLEWLPLLVADSTSSPDAARSTSGPPDGRLRSVRP